MKKNRICLTLAIFLLQGAAFVPLSAESSSAKEPSAGVHKILTAAFSREDRAGIIESLEAGAQAQKLPADKKAVLVALAGYEERLGLADAASGHYNEAAFADSAARDDNVLLDAARCALASNDTAKADGYVRAVLLTCFDDKILLRARVYAAWIQLSSGDRDGSLPLLRAYAQNAVFADYAPRLLFTLWWADGDHEAKDRLLSAFSSSPEAAIVRGEKNLSPTPFWYLMSRNDGSITAFARDGNKSLASSGKSASAAVSPASPASSGSPLAVSAPSSGSDAAPSVLPAATVTPEKTGAPSVLSAAGSSGSTKAVGPVKSAGPVAPVAPTTGSAVVTAVPAGSTSASPSAVPAVTAGREWQQAGFFKNKENADELAAKLEKLGFHPVVRSETRPSGTVYFAVLVPEDRNRTAEGRLKDAGFESYLVTD